MAVNHQLWLAGAQWKHGAHGAVLSSAPCHRDVPQLWTAVAAAPALVEHTFPHWVPNLVGGAVKMQRC